MNKLYSLAVLVLIAPRAFCASNRSEAPLRERYFNADWARVSEKEIPPLDPAGAAPSAKPAETPFHATYAAVSHMTLTIKAFELYAAHYPGGELARFIGGMAGERPDSGNHDTVVAGAYEEDMPFQNPFGEALPFNRHFWDYRKGDNAGLASYGSSVNRAYKYWSGGFGMDGQYDVTWSANLGPLRGEKALGAAALYRKGDKAKAYWYLGHIAHLIEDLTVPAHSHCFPHPFEDSDAYESYMGFHYREWGALPAGPLESFPTLYDIFRKTTEVAHGFDAGSGPGPLSGVDGDADQGRRRAARFPEAMLKEEAAVLMPLAYKRVAALFVYFYKQVDRTPPEVRLDSPTSDRSPARRFALSASASDDQSGVDRNSYGFEYRSWNGTVWTPWRSVPEKLSGFGADFALPAGGELFAFRALASDAAGNIGLSPVKYIRTEPGP